MVAIPGSLHQQVNSKNILNMMNEQILVFYGEGFPQAA